MSTDILLPVDIFPDFKSSISPTIIIDSSSVSGLVTYSGISISDSLAVTPFEYDFEFPSTVSVSVTL